MKYLPRFYNSSIPVVLFTLLLLHLVFVQSFTASAQNTVSYFTDIPSNWIRANAVEVLPLTGSVFKTSKGEGILVNTAPAKSGKHLVANEQHADVDVSFEFMMAPGGNSGIYLMGRYEVQLYDSWGVVQPRFFDCGGVFTSPGQSKRPDLNEGVAPLMNAAKAPGLWQQMHIEFQAPRFDASGKKLSNARIISVMLNGSQVQKNVEIPDVSPYAPLTDEAASGPLIIQGDMGQIAIRNIQVQKFDGKAPVLGQLTYQVFEGDFSKRSNAIGLKAKHSGTTALFDINLADISDDVAFEFDGIFSTQEAGNYKLSIKASSRVALYVNGKLHTDTTQFFYYGNTIVVETPLNKGENSIRLGLYKSNKRVSPTLAITCSRHNLRPVKWNDPGSEAGLSNYAPVMIRTKGAPTLQRTFIEHEGRKRPYCMVVNEFPGINYAVNLETMGLIKIWQGEMGDAGEMWSNRGDRQSIYPPMRWEELPNFPLLLKSEFEAGADTAANGKCPEFKAYQIDKAGLPVFEYAFAGGQIVDQIAAAEGVKKVKRKMQFKNMQQPSIYVLGKGKSIQTLSEGLHAIDGQRYWVQFATKDKKNAPKVKQQSGSQWLYVEVPTGNFEIEYLIIR